MNNLESINLEALIRELLDQMENTPIKAGETVGQKMLIRFRDGLAESGFSHGTANGIALAWKLSVPSEAEQFSEELDRLVDFFVKFVHELWSWFSSNRLGSIDDFVAWLGNSDDFNFTLTLK